MMVRSEVDLTITTFGTLLIAGADAHDYKLVQEVTVTTSLHATTHTCIPSVQCSKAQAAAGEVLRSRQRREQLSCICRGRLLRDGPCLQHNCILLLTHRLKWLLHVWFEVQCSNQSLQQLRLCGHVTLTPCEGGDNEQ